MVSVWLTDYTWIFSNMFTWDIIHTRLHMGIHEQEHIPHKQTRMNTCRQMCRCSQADTHTHTHTCHSSLFSSLVGTLHRLASISLNLTITLTTSCQTLTLTQVLILKLNEICNRVQHFWSPQSHQTLSGLQVLGPQKCRKTRHHTHTHICNNNFQVHTYIFFYKL